MKKTLLFFSFTLSLSLAAIAQRPDADQNPNHKLAEVKYTGQQETIQQNNHETVQQTYTAFDFYQDKLDKKKERLAFNRQLQLLRAQSRPAYFQGKGRYGSFYNGCQYHRHW